MSKILFHVFPAFIICCGQTNTACCGRWSWSDKTFDLKQEFSQASGNLLTVNKLAMRNLINLPSRFIRVEKLKAEMYLKALAKEDTLLWTRCC